MAESTGARIRRYRERAGMSQTALAARVGLRKQSLSSIELGKRAVKDTELRDICLALEVSSDQLLGLRRVQKMGIERDCAGERR